MSSSLLKPLGIKTKAVLRMIKDLDASDKEMALQQKRIRDFEQASDKDEHDVRKQVSEERSRPRRAHRRPPRRRRARPFLVPKNSSRGLLLRSWK